MKWFLWCFPDWKPPNVPSPSVPLNLFAHLSLWNANNAHTYTHWLPWYGLEMLDISLMEKLIAKNNSEIRWHAVKLFPRVSTNACSLSLVCTEFYSHWWLIASHSPVPTPTPTTISIPLSVFNAPQLHINPAKVIISSVGWFSSFLSALV